jgi:hypothetical protein
MGEFIASNRRGFTNFVFWFFQSLEDFKETGDETFAWESFEKKLSAYSFLKYLVQENDIHVDLSGLNTFLSFNRK